MKRLTFDAIACHQNNFTFYIASIPKKDLIPLCFIIRRHEDRKKGFQRFLNESRAKSIAKYMDGNKGSIPSPIILSAQKGVNFNFKNGRISFDNKINKSFLVLDGQHRLYGYELSEKSFMVPIVVYSGLSISQEVSLFIDINSNQKGVPTALLLDIKQIAGTETSLEEKQRIVFDKLMEDSVLTGHLSPDQSRRGKISRSAFNDSTKSLFERGTFKNKDAEIIFKGIKNYLEASELALDVSKSEAAKLYKTVIFKSLFQMFNEVITKTLTEHGNVKTPSIFKVIEPIGTISYENFSGAGNATIRRLTTAMRDEINKYSEIHDDMF